MTIRTLKHWGTALWLILLGASLAAAQLTVKDVISLKKLGFSDAEILAEAAKSGAKMALTEADLAQLKAAGASDALIQALRNPPREITLDEVKRMVQAGQSADRIIEAIAASPNKPAAGAADVLEMQRQNVPVAVLFALRGRPLGAADLRSLAEEHTAPPVFERLGNLLGYIQTDLAAEEALALMRIGVPADSVKGLKTAVAVPPQPKNDPKTEPPLPAPPEPVEELVGTWEGTIKSAGMTANAVLTLDRNGEYSLNMASYLQQGRWSAVHNNLVLSPNDGMEEAERYELKNGTLLIKSQTALLTLRRRR